MTYSGSLTADSIKTSAVYHSDGTKMLSVENGEVHLGNNSMVFVEEGSVDVMKSTMGSIQIGNTSSDTTTIKGSLTVEDPTSYYHAAHKGYVDEQDEQSVALTAALTSLPTAGGNGTHACGIGTGHRGSATAIAMGCATDFANLSPNSTLPAFLQNASLNAGTSFLTSGESDLTLKAGLTWRFGAESSRKQAKVEEPELKHRLARVESRNRKQNRQQTETIKKLQTELETMRAQMQQIAALLAQSNVVMVKAPVAATNKELVGIKLPAEASVIGKTLEDISLPNGTIVCLIISKEGIPSLPLPDTLLGAQDEIVAVTTVEGEEALWEILTRVS